MRSYSKSLNTFLKYTYTLTTTASLSVGLISFASAETATPNNANNSAKNLTYAAAPADQNADEGGRGGFIRNLSPDEKKKLKAAHDAALNDPSVKAAEAQRGSNPQAYRKAVHDAMVKADPSVGPILDRIKQHRQSMWGALSPEEKSKLRAAHQAAKNDPAVVSARQQWKSANTPEAKQEARRAMWEAQRSAMVKADPSVKAILDKMRSKAE